MSEFSPATLRWFSEAFESPTEVQRRGWETIGRGEHALLIAPTGSGKTLAAFLWALDRLSGGHDADTGVKVLYVSPLKALVHDIERNLRAPLAGIQRAAERAGESMRALRVDVRTGDTPQAERRAQARNPGDVLVTTPESLFLILGSKARETLRSVHTVIVDEVHALAARKRGAHLALSLERLSALTASDPQRIGLSATVRPAEMVASWLGGDRPVTVIDAAARPALDVEVCVPVPDMEAVNAANASGGGSILAELYAREVGTPVTERGIWSVVYPELLAHIVSHRSTIVFVNSRGLCERVVHALNELAGEEIALAHHGSVSHVRRAEIEDQLKQGQVRALVATSSLELGIDMGAVDQVLLVESPGSVARGLQRVGRAGHHVGDVSRGRIYPKFKADLLESAVVASRMRDGAIEAIQVPRNALDVLAQQVVAMVCDGELSRDDVTRLVRRAWSYRELSDDAMTAVLEMLSGHYPGGELADLRPRITWDRASDRLSARRGAAMMVRVNAGTIPDRGHYAVHAGEDGPRVGELDEEMVFETRIGDVIVLGASSWRVEAIDRDRVIVTPAPGEPGRLPFWRGDGLGRPLELGRAIGAMIRELGNRARDEALAWLARSAPLDDHARANLVDYVHAQKAHCGALPTDRAIVIERFRDEIGDWRVCVLTPYGARVHAPWAMALQKLLSDRYDFDIQVMYTDDGIAVRFADADSLPDTDELIPSPDEVQLLVTEQLRMSALFAGLFRENAARALLLPRRAPNRRAPLWAQRQRAQALLGAVRGYPGFPIVLETYREALADHFDMHALGEVLTRVRSREVAVHDVETRSASPFARSLVFAWVASYIYEQDAPMAERRAQALTLDRDLLAELLGQGELRELIDADVLDDYERTLQALDPDRAARDADELHDLLRRVGDLSANEIAARASDDPSPWCETLERQLRAISIRIAGEQRFIAAEDAGLYRDALGAVPPAGLPTAYLAPVDDALEMLARRFARRRGPFTSHDLAIRYDLSDEQITLVLSRLCNRGDLVHGEIRPGGSGLEWCDAEVLRVLKRRTLARLRNQVAAVDAATLARFLPHWQGAARNAERRLEEAIVQLEGIALPFSAIETTLLPARVPGFSRDALDRLCASGQLVWVGRGALGVGDGRIALYTRGNARLLIDTPLAEPPDDPIHAAMISHLERHGASFMTEIEDAVRSSVAAATLAEIESALWDLVWLGLITNDTFAPLRQLGRRRAQRRARDLVAGGRWSLVARLIQAEASDTERAVARAAMLLERYGIVSREAVLAEDLPGGFAAVRGVLSHMEDTGQVRRGYFIEGLGGTQYALPGAVDRLRGFVREPGDDDREDPQIEFLSAIDPANPFGTLLAWPQCADESSTRPRRVASAWLATDRGHAIAYVVPGARRVTTFATAAPHAVAAAIAALGELPKLGRSRALVIESIDGVDVVDSPWREQLAGSGFVRDYRGMVLERSF